MSKQRIKCLCGKEITPNTWSRHSKSSACSLDSDTKASIAQVLERRKTNPRGWRKRDGEEAVGDDKWYVSVITGETVFDDWTFFPPREPHLPRPSALKRMSVERTGTNNPSVKSKILSFSKEEVLTFAKDAFNQCVMNEDMVFGDVEKLVEEKYPNFKYLTGLGSGWRFLRLVSGLTREEIAVMSAKRRGIFISKGQRNSASFAKKASESASKMLSKWRVTVPHLILFELIKNVDPVASIEYRLTDPYGRSKSFDIHSPKLGGVIEMHGRVWHDATNCKNDKLLALVNKNVKNDEAKKKLAESAGLRHFVFWDDQMSSWCDQIEDIYGAKPTLSLEEAKDKINQKSRRTAGL